MQTCGNFLAHLTEQSLREFGDFEAWRGYELAFRSRFLQLAGSHLAESVELYTVLSLARHIYLSTQFVERQPLTEAILELCEQRLGLDVGQAREITACRPGGIQ